MKNKKFLAAAMTAALAVSMLGTSVMAAETSAKGTTNFTYTPGTAGPVDPVNPGEEETSVNNWMVVYPRSITLTDSNVETGDTFNNGAELTFTVKQKQAGADGDDTIKEANIPSGVSVTAEGANATGDYTLSGGEGSAIMQLAGFDGSSKITSAANELGLLLHDAATQSGKAKISNASGIVDGNTYTTSVTFTFVNPGV